MFSQKVTKESTFEVCILGPECVRPKLQHYMIFMNTRSWKVQIAADQREFLFCNSLYIILKTP